MRESPNPRELLIALVCGLPVSLMAAYGLPWMFLTSVALLSGAPTTSALSGVAFFAACVLAIVTYWRLAILTALQKRFTFGPTFWLSIAGASYVVIELSGWFSGLQSILLLAGPPAASASYFSMLQFKGFSGKNNAG